MTTEDDLPPGWGRPRGALMVHYFPALSMVSLCGTYRHYDGPREHPKSAPAKGDCVMCGLALSKQKEK